MSPVIIPPGVQFLSLTRPCLFTGYPSVCGLRNRSLGAVPFNSDYIWFTLKVLIHNFTQLSYGGLLTHLCYYRVSIMTTAIAKITLDLISSSGVNTKIRHEITKSSIVSDFPGLRVICKDVSAMLLLKLHRPSNLRMDQVANSLRTGG